MAKVRAEVVAPPVAVLGERSVRKLSALQEGLYENRQRWHSTHVGRHAGPALRNLAQHLVEHSLCIVPSLESSAKSAPPTLAPADCPTRRSLEYFARSFLPPTSSSSHDGEPPPVQPHG